MLITDRATKISRRPRTMLIAKTNFGIYDNSDTSEDSIPTTSASGPVVVRQATARTSASSNNIPNIARIIVTKAKLIINNIKKIHAIKTEISKVFWSQLGLANDEGWSNFPVSFEKAENKTDTRSNFMPPAVVANPPPNKHKPIRIIVMWGMFIEGEAAPQNALT